MVMNVSSLMISANLATKGKLSGGPVGIATKGKILTLIHEVVSPAGLPVYVFKRIISIIFKRASL